jgi:hypothetical protein
VLNVRRLVERVIPRHPGIVLVVLPRSARTRRKGLEWWAYASEVLPDVNGPVLKVFVVPD